MNAEAPDYVTVFDGCDVPPEGVTFRVIRQEWNAAFTERRIFEWERASHDADLFMRKSIGEAS